MCVIHCNALLSKTVVVSNHSSLSSRTVFESDLWDSVIKLKQLLLSYRAESLDKKHLDSIDHGAVKLQYMDSQLLKLTLMV